MLRRDDAVVDDTQVRVGIFGAHVVEALARRRRIQQQEFLGAIRCADHQRVDALEHAGVRARFGRAFATDSGRVNAGKEPLTDRKILRGNRQSFRITRAQFDGDLTCDPRTGLTCHFGVAGRSAFGEQGRRRWKTRAERRR